MNTIMTTSHPWAQRLRFVWILEPRKDLVFYLGSALAGWLYAGLIWYAIQTLANPLEEPLGILRLGHTPHQSSG